MRKYREAIARIAFLDCDEIVTLHFEIQEEIKKQYKLRKNQQNLDNAIMLCEKSVAISALVMEAMKKKHRKECDEYARTIGELSPNIKFQYPSHYAANQLCVILRKSGELRRLSEIEGKITREGWGSGKCEELF